MDVKRISHWIDGKPWAGVSERSGDVFDPATGRVSGRVDFAGESEVDEAVSAAARAFSSWRNASLAARSGVLFAFRGLLNARRKELAEIVTAEHGKVLDDAGGEIQRALEAVDFACGIPQLLKGGFSENVSRKVDVYSIRQPLGVVGVISPFNFPAMVPLWFMPNAIACGNAVVLKPSEKDPSASNFVAELWAEAGLPDGVLNVLTTDRAAEVVEPMLVGGDIRKLSFTGSTEVGRLLLAQAAANVVKTSLELGGNAPFIVFDDADLDRAVDGAMVAKMRNMGEACTAANRFFVHESVVEDFAGRLADRMSALRVGPGMSRDSQVGPLIDADGLAKVAGLVEDAVSRGARVVTGGSAIDGDGFFYRPTVLVDVDPGSDMCSTEIFGPVAAIQTFTDAQDAVRQANDTEWGLVGYVFTQDIDRAFAVSEALEVGMVGVNAGLVSNPATPFGGVKQSGLGREGGRVGIEEFLEQKLIVMPRG
jgi:succinate-semialdehyde dehydrogenase/glutarate-semialdehyde dehydrogenase